MNIKFEKKNEHLAPDNTNTVKTLTCTYSYDN